MRGSLHGFPAVLSCCERLRKGSAALLVSEGLYSLGFQLEAVLPPEVSASQQRNSRENTEGEMELVQILTASGGMFGFKASSCHKGRMASPKRMNFRKSSKRGGGSFSIPKFILQILDL